MRDDWMLLQHAQHHVHYESEANNNKKKIVKREAKNRFARTHPDSSTAQFKEAGGKFIINF